jgi:3,4-dihydroxy-2-butanone 4-phosphate synthase
MIISSLSSRGIRASIVASTGRPAFTISIDAKATTTTGISAFDRSNTIAALIDPLSSNSDFVAPGHVFPLVATSGGVLIKNAGNIIKLIFYQKLKHLTGFSICGKVLQFNQKEDWKTFHFFMN